jgi:hypothetical protein
VEYLIKGAESACIANRAEFDLARLRVSESRAKIKSSKLRNKLDELSDLLEATFSHENAYQQAMIYKALGGPTHLSTAFKTEIEMGAERGATPGEAETRENTPAGAGSGQIRAVDLIPRQTALNVNTSHSQIKHSAASAAWRALFGFGLKVDYQLQREKYDQFMQQEAFASGIGKGQATFGWIFGPLPGSRVLNSGTRNTYAVLTVPDDATAMEIEGVGCAFHRKSDPVEMYPLDLDTNFENCGKRMISVIGIPGRDNSGGFWPTDVDYRPVHPGEQAVVILRGTYFSPQTAVLVNGRRLPQVLGLGKPRLHMDADTGDRRRHLGRL